MKGYRSDEAWEHSKKEAMRRNAIRGLEIGSAIDTEYGLKRPVSWPNVFLWFLQRNDSTCSHDFLGLTESVRFGPIWFGIWQIWDLVLKMKVWVLFDLLRFELCLDDRFGICSKGSGFLVVFDEEEEEDWSSSGFGGNERDKFVFNFLF